MDQPRTALLIHSYAGANSAISRHWPYYTKSGFDIFGVGRVDKLCLWPVSMMTKNIGLDSYICGDNLPRRLVDTFRWFIEDPIFDCYTHCMVIEWDGVFLMPPKIITPEVGGHLAGFLMAPMKTLKYYHCPWWLSRAMAKVFVSTGDKLLAAGDIEYGNPDFFFGYVFQTVGIPVEHLIGTYSRNSIESQDALKEVRILVRGDQIWFVHGVKSAEALKFITT